MIDASEARTVLIDHKIRKSQRIVRLMIWTIIPITILTLALAWIFYAESYEFVYEFISNLGHITTSDENNVNTTSMIIMTTGFSLLALVSLIIAIFYFIRPVLQFNKIKGSLYVLIAVGAAGVGVPGDHPTLTIVHQIGAVMFIFGLAIVNFVHQMLRFTRKHDLKFEKKPFNFYFDMLFVVIVFTAMILLGITYILDKTGISSPAFGAPLWQKIVLLVDLIAVFVLDLDDM